MVATRAGRATLADDIGRHLHLVDQAREEASEGKKESGSHRESSNHREKAKLGAEIWKPVGIGKQIPVTLHPFEADEMTRMPAGVDM